MKKFLYTLALSGGSLMAFGQQPQAVNDSAMIASIYAEVMTHAECYENLRYLCKNIGHRLAGS